MPLALGRARTAGGRAQPAAKPRVSVPLLQSQLLEKAMELRQLQEERESLLLQHQLLIALCDAFDDTRHRLYAQQHRDGCPVPPEEQQLLAELRGSAASGGGGSSGGGSSGSGDGAASQPSVSWRELQQQCAAPVHDAFMLLREAMATPGEARYATITLAQLQHEFAAAVQRLAMLLHRLERCREAPAPALPHGPPVPPPGARAGDVREEDVEEARAAQQGTTQPWLGEAAAQQALAEIRAIQLRMFKIITSLGWHHRGDMVFQLSLTNFETGERLPAFSKTRHASAVSKLDLSAQQIERLQAGVAMLSRLLIAVGVERRALHAQLHAVHSHEPGQAGAGVAAAYAQSRGAQLEASQDLARRLRLVESKDVSLRATFASLLYGSLSWVQQARLRVLMAPHHPNAGIFFEMLRHHAAQQAALRAQELQQQRQQVQRRARAAARQQEEDEQEEEEEGPQQQQQLQQQLQKLLQPAPPSRHLSGLQLPPPAPPSRHPSGSTGTHLAYSSGR